jgi:uncharacterized damage-inducible protein DinB
MFHTIEEFLQEWNQEAAGSERILNHLTDASLPQQIAENHFTLGELGWHIANSIPVFAGQLGIEVPYPGDYKEVPTQASVIAEGYAKTNRAFVEALRSSWNDADIAQVRQVFGREMANGVTLRMLIQHQTHHRGQMTVLMRQAGLTVPGLYGPSREEYAEMLKNK